MRKAIGLVLLVCAAGLANAQDWPTLQGSDARTGINSNPATSGPGQAFIGWYAPFSNNGGTFERHVMSPEASRTNQGTDWTGYGPNDSLSEAGGLYLPLYTGTATEDTFSGYTAYASLLNTFLASGGTSPEPTDYYWKTAIPSSTNPTQPTIKLNGGDSLDTFVWQIEPAQTVNRIANNYGIYVWIPTGPTGTGGSTISYPQNDFVYTITDASGQTYTDVVDTTISGGGWVRLGNGGFPTTRTFAYNGATAITVTLYNTIPRDATGNLLGTTAQLVYADAVMAIPQSGYYDSSPIVSAFDPVSGLGTIHTVAAQNQVQVTQATATAPSVSTTIGRVTSYNYNDGTVRWHWSPLDLQSNVMTTSSAGVTAPSPWASNATNVGQKGTTWLAAPVTNTLPGTRVVYAPAAALADGNYTVQIWIPGSNGGFSFAQGLTYYIDEGINESGPFTINQDSVGGWVTLGTRLYTHSMAGSQPLSVVVTNYSALTSDATRTAFTDAVQFVGQTNLAIESTPIQANVPIVQSVGGTPVTTAVTLVAAENGRIYCLDSTGNGNGGTTLYWAYPSLSTVIPDPNQVTGLDGPGPTAQMPVNFSLSSALVEEDTTGHPYLYIGSQNGRIYKIDMEGRGDTTTTRIWSYPDDYPSLAKPSSLGAISGSLAYVNDGTVLPEIIVPTMQGRMYSLDAAGSPASKTTFVRWQFPNGNETDSGFGAFANGGRNPGDATWTNPANAQYVDQSYATVTPDAGTGSGSSEYLISSAGTSLNIPTGARISGIQVSVVRHRSGGDSGLTIKDAEVELVKAGTVQTGAGFNRADTADDWLVPSTTIQETGTPAGGTFTITAGALGTTAPIPYNATAVQVQSALNAIAGLSVTASGGPLPNGIVTVTFNSPAFSPPTLTSNASGLTGTTPGVTLVPTIDETKVYGGMTDLWGQASWTPADFGATFGVAIAATGNGNSTTNTVLPTAGIDYVQVRVFYGASQTLGPIAMTPTVAFGDIYFGTRLKLGDSTSALSGFFAINQDTGVPDANWVTNNSANINAGAFVPGNTYNFGDYVKGTDGVTYFSIGNANVGNNPTGGGSPTWWQAYYGQFNGAPVTGSLFAGWGATTLGDFQSGAVAIPAAQLNVLGTGQSDSIVVMNENLYLTSLFADGTTGGSPQWTTNELGTGVYGNLAYTQMTVYNNVSTSSSPSSSPAPVVMVPTEDGRFDAMFALNDGILTNGIPSGGGTPTFGAKNQQWARQAWEYRTPAPSIKASFSSAHGFLYAADTAGYLYAFSNTAGSGYGTGPGSFTQTANNPGGSTYATDFAGAKAMFISPTDYLSIRQGRGTYDALKTEYQAGTGATPSKDYGQSLYICVFNFPYSVLASAGGYSMVNIQQASSTGSALGTLSAQSIGPLGATPPTGNLSEPLDGVAVARIYLNPSVNMPAPGPVNINLSFNVVPSTGSGSTNIAINPPPTGLLPGTGTSYLQYILGNPLALVMQYDTSGNPISGESLGYDSAGAITAQDKINGNPVGNLSLLGISGGDVPHNTSTTVRFGVYNRTLLPNGLPNVHLIPTPLAWQNNSVVNPIPNLFPSLEDMPTGYPNTSLDYPDIPSDLVAAVSDPSGSANNPMYGYGATLKAATNYNVGGAAWSPLQDPITATVSRTLNETEWDLTLNVPHFQPPNELLATDSNGQSIPGGYRSDFTIYSGANNNTTTVGPNQAYRNFWMNVSVQPDFRLHSSTPTVDLGALSQGAGEGMNSSSPWAANSPFKQMFQPFNVTNDGNVNSLNLGVAKQKLNTSPPVNLGVSATNGNSLNWLDAYTDLHTDIDSQTPISPALNWYTADGDTSLNAIIQKARAGSTTGTVLTTDPIRQYNPILGVSQGPVFTSGPTPAAPRITVSVPFGFPVGTYSQLMQIFDGNQVSTTQNYQIGVDSNDNPISGEYVAQPSFTLTFRVKETELTGQANPFVNTMLDNYVTGTETNLFANGQPGAYRDATQNLHVAFTSTRGTYAPGTGPSSAQIGNQKTVSNSMIYIASLVSGGPLNGQNPLKDLDQFVSSAQWFSQDLGPYPSASLTNSLFVPTGTSYSVNTNYPVNYENPAFAGSPYNPLVVDSNGIVSTATGNQNGNPFMVFTGEAQVNTGNATITNSKVFIAQGSVSSGVMSMGTPVPLPDDLSNPALIDGTVKQHPTVVQFGNSATVFYTTNATGGGEMHCATYNASSTPAWTNNIIQMPAAFASVSSPQATGRVTAGGKNYLELVFSGKLVSRPHADIFLARIPCSASGVPLATPIVLNDLYAISGETLVSAKNGVYQAAGVDWDTSEAVTLTINGTALNTQQQVDPKSGIISQENNVLGGTLFFDPNNGTVQFSGNTPAPSAVVALSYTPRILRVSSGGVTALNPTVLYDTRQLFGTDLNQWYDQTGTPVSGSVTLSASRYDVLYSGASSGTGQAARPYLSTYRFGVQLPSPIGINPNTNQPVSLHVSLQSGPGGTFDYEVDPAKGRIYFTSAEEGVAFNISYTDINGNVIADAANGYAANLVVETAETPIAVDGAVNEAQVTSFLDPLAPVTALGRPGLIWLFWSSTRNGSPDVFFESIAPNFAPTASSP
ncbi:MAG TPA: PQQ-binding-like beta-propeller repeat protein [Fimbriimonadaceae bacterium]|jgi:hypothetical protein